MKFAITAALVFSLSILPVFGDMALFDDIDWELITASEKNDFARVRELVQKGAYVRITSSDQSTPLYYAVKNNNHQIVEFLLKKGADVNTVPLYIGNPLMEAVNDVKMVALLLKYGAQVNCKNIDGRTALDLAVETGNGGVISLLKKHGALEGDRVKNNCPSAVPRKEADNELFSGAYDGDLEMIKSALSKKANIRLIVKYTGENVLSAAATSGNVDVARYLVSRGADKNNRCVTGATPLHRAAMYDRKSMVEYLISVKANVNAKDRFGKTSWDYAGDAVVKDIIKKAGGISGK